MTLVDTGPLVALFDPRDPHHARCTGVLRDRPGPWITTVPVLTEAFHLLNPASRGSGALRQFLLRRGLSVWFLDAPSLLRALNLMQVYADHPMDLADASLVTAAERLNLRQIFTVDRRDFAAYRITRGHRHVPLRIIP